MVLDTELPCASLKPNHGDVLVATAKRLERLQARRRKLRRDLKAVDNDIRLETRHLRALLQQVGKGADR